MGHDPLLRKTVMCKFFAMGQCNKGSACTFAHDESELVENPDLRCTQLCKTFWATGSCSAGDACDHAHSPSDVRRRPARACIQAQLAPSCSSSPLDAPNKVLQCEAINSQPHVLTSKHPTIPDENTALPAIWRSMFVAVPAVIPMVCLPVSKQEEVFATPMNDVAVPAVIPMVRLPPSKQEEVFATPMNDADDSPCYFSRAPHYPPKSDTDAVGSLQESDSAHDSNEAEVEVKSFRYGRLRTVKLQPEFSRVKSAPVSS